MGKVLRERRDAILESWFQRVSRRPQASGLPRETVMNNIPGLLDEIIAALEKPQAMRAVVDIPRAVADKHGESRLELGYGLEELGEEYNSLREALMDALREANVKLDEPDAEALHASVDQAHRAGVERYVALRQEHLRRRQSDFLARLSHDFRSPLSTIVTSVDLLHRDLPAEVTRADRNLDRIRGAARWLLRLVEGQLMTEQALSGALQPHFEEQELGAALSDILEMMRSRAESKHLQFHVRVPAGLRIRTDWLMLGQVVQNLLDNAVKYTTHGSISFSAAAEGASLRIVVEDTGRGISPDLLPVIFDMYQRWEHVSPGHGIGLATVKVMVNTLGGSVQVTSEPDKGSRFTVLIPQPPEQ